MSGKRGRPKGSGGQPQFHSQHAILFALWDNVRPLSLKQIVEITGLDRKTVISCLKFFEKRGVVEGKRVGRQYRRYLTPYGLEYWFKLRVKHGVLRTVPFKFQLIQTGKIARLIDRYGITWDVILKRLSVEYPESKVNPKVFNEKIIPVAYKLVNEAKRKREIVLD